VGLTGTLIGINVSLTSMPVGGQTITLNRTIAGDSFTGTYTINGGCASGEQGKIRGVRIPFIANNLSGTFTSSINQAFDVTGNLAQASTSSWGKLRITGPASFAGSCLASGTITSGTFPSGSSIMGT